MTDGAVRLYGRVRHTSRRAAVALSAGSLRIVADEYHGIWTGLDDRDDSRHRPGPERRRPARRNGHRDQHRHQGACRPRSPTTAGQYLFAGLFPGTYDLKVELSGFKTYEQKGLPLSPNDNRGIDVRLEVGQQTETVTVTSAARSDSDGDGRARRRAHRQADRQPVGHRPQRARTDAHPSRRRHRVQPGRVGRASAAAATTPRATPSTASARRATPSRSTARRSSTSAATAA